jgi:endonuclease-3
MESLTTLRGVGRKTANVVRAVAFGLPAFTVDTHVKRLAGRLGLSAGATPEAIERDVMGLLAPEHWEELSIRLILHGRRVCTARRPGCDACGLRAECPWPARAVRRS